MTEPSSRVFEKNVFINCPFDPAFTPLLHSILFTIVQLGFNPRIATERSDSGEIRIEKVCELIKTSKYSLHDLSRLQATKKSEFFRLNMPFELGIDYGSRKFAGGRFSSKKFLILSKAPFTYAKALSDLSGVDIKTHGDEPAKAVRAVRNWLQQYVDGKVAPPNAIWTWFNYFMEDFHETRATEGFSEDDIYEMPMDEFIAFIKAWIGQKRILWRPA